MASLNLLTQDGRPKERCLVTGATGFLGSHCVDQLLREHYIVRGSVRDLQDRAKVNPIKALATGPNDRLELVEADLFLHDSWDQAVSGCDYVIHVASPVPAHEPKHASDVITPALDGTLAVLDACRRSGHVKKVVITSSALSVYDALVSSGMETSQTSHIDMTGNNSGDKSSVHTEDEWTDLQAEDGSLHNVFVQSKVRSEKAAWNFIETLDALNTTDISAILKDDAILPTNSNISSPSPVFTPVDGIADTSASALPRPHSNSVNRLLTKQSRHKASVTNVRHPCCSFPLTTILPVLMTGPCIHGGNALAAQLIHSMLVGGAEMPIIPGLAVEICDVRDVARAHVRALKTSASDSKRILVFTCSIWLRDIAQILSREFLAYGYRVPTRPAPRWFTKLYTFIRRDLSWLRRRKPNHRVQFSNERMQQILGVSPTPIEETFVDMAHSLIQRGDIRMTPLYRKRMEKLAAEAVLGRNGRNNSVSGHHRDTEDDKTASSAANNNAVDDDCSPGSSNSSLGGLLMQSRENSAGNLSVDGKKNDDVVDHSGRIKADTLLASGQEAEEFEVLPDGRVIESPKKKRALVSAHHDNTEQILKAAADIDDDEMRNRDGEMKSYHNIDSDDDNDVYEDAAETAMIAAEEGEKYKY